MRPRLLSGTSAIWQFGILADSPKFGDSAKLSNHNFCASPRHGHVCLVDVVPGQLSVFLTQFGTEVCDLLNLGRGQSQNPQKLTLAALKFGGGNVKNRRFGVKWVVSDKTNQTGTLGVLCLAQIPKDLEGDLKGRLGSFSL